MSMRSIGIDFGTTKTLVAYLESGQPHFVRLGLGSDYIPTTVYVESKDEMFFGDEADDRMAEDATRYCRGFKMKLGDASPVLFVPEEGLSFRAKELTAAFLRYIRQRCEEEEFMGAKEEEAVITCPVLFSPAQREELKQAAEQAGFREVRLAMEPESAGYAFCRLCPQTAFNGNALIVDWGGGTLDLALVSRDRDRVVARRGYTEGDPNMGGELFDSRLFQYVRRRLKEDKGIDLMRESASRRSVLLGKIRKFKEKLSKQSPLGIRLSDNQGVYPPITVTREEFESLIADDLDKAADMAQRLVSSIRQEELRPKLVLLVGGTCGIPAISSRLQKMLGLPCHTWNQSREAVALGAAFLAVEETEVPAPEAAHGTPAPAVVEQSLAAQDHLKLGMDLFYSNNPQDYPGAAAHFAKGHEQGNLNCTALLAECYLDGIGVGKDVDMVKSLADLMVGKDYAPGYYFLAVLHESGAGVPMDPDYARRCRAELARRCTRDIPGIPAVVRYRYLLLACLAPELKGTLLGYAREYAEVTPYTDKFASLATAMLDDCMESGTGKSELRQVLDDGCSAGCPICMYLKSVLIRGDNDIYPDNPSLARTLAGKAAESGLPMAVFNNLAYLESADRLRNEVDRFWKICRMGSSQILAPNALDVEVRVQDGFSALMNVYEGSVLRRFIQAGRHADIVRPCAADLSITNKEGEPLRNVSVRICCPATKTEHSFTIEALRCGEPYVFDPNLQGLSLQNNVSIDVSCGGRRSVTDISPMEGYEVFSPALPPLLMAWKKGFFGGFVLMLLCTEGRLTNVSVRRIGADGHSNPVVLDENADPTEIGWCEMSDSTGLKENEPFAVVMDGYAPVVGFIRTSEHDESSAGWTSVVKWIGTGAAIALGSS